MSEKKTKADSMLYLGIDLGTSRSVISASNGRRKWVLSYVGWPKDFVARKMLGKSVLFGEEALDHRLALNLHRPLENGVLKEGTEQDEAAVADLIGHLVEMAGLERSDNVCVAVGVPAEALKINKLAIKNSVARHADKLMVVSEPFAVAYGLGTLDNAMVIDIGAGTVDFCIMHGTVPGEDDQRSLLTAGDFVDQQLLKLLGERYPEADFTPTMIRRFKEKYSFVGEPDRQIEVRVPVEGKMVAVNITEEMRKACESMLAPIVESTMDLVANFDPEYQEQVRNNILLAGGGSQIRGIAEYLTHEMEKFEACKFKCVDDPLYAGADGALELAKDMPEEYLEKL